MAQDALRPPPDLDRIVEALVRLMSGKYDLDLPIVDPDNPGDVIFAGLNMLGEELAARDRERDQARAQLQHSDRLAVVGELSGSVAHELNNPLTAVCLAVAAIQADLSRLDFDELAELAGCPELRDFPEHLSTVVEGTSRCRKVARSLLRFAAHQGGQRRRADLREALDSALTLVRNRALIRGIELDVQLPEPLEAVVDLDLMVQVAVNLLINALQAQSNGGCIRIQGQRASGTVGFTVADDGPGVPPELFDRVFEPFVTTKGEHGTGLGLSVSRRIVMEHGGDIELHQRSPRGAEFSVWVPEDGADR